MKRASYRNAVNWIAWNDNAGCGEGAEDIGSYVSSVLIAEIFDVPSSRVGKDIERIRIKNGMLPKTKKGKKN